MHGMNGVKFTVIGALFGKVYETLISDLRGRKEFLGLLIVGAEEKEGM
jgi:hypothetical protein